MRKHRIFALLLAGLLLVQTALAAGCDSRDAAAFWMLAEDRPDASTYLVDFDADGRAELLMLWVADQGRITYQVYGAEGKQLGGATQAGFTWSLVQRDGKTYLARQYQQYYNPVTEYFTVQGGKWVMADMNWAQADANDPNQLVAYKVGGVDTTEHIYTWALGSYETLQEVGGYAYVAGHRDTDGLKAGGAASKPSDWAAAEVAAADASGVTIYRDGHSYQSPATRAQFAEGVMRAVVQVAGWPLQPEKRPFSDCDDYWVLTAYEAGIVNGTSATTFAPDRRVTRQEIAVMLHRAVKYLETKTGKSVLTQAGDISSFADAAQVASWAKEGVSAMNAAGIVKGSGLSLYPAANCTLEQAQMLCARIVALFQ